MAVSAPSTPRSNFATPRRLGIRTPGPVETPDCFSKVTVETPLATRRRGSKDKYDELRNLTVAVRVRPMNSRELACVGASSVVKVKDQDLVVCSGSGSAYIEHIFQYDHIFWSMDEESSRYSSQEDVFLTLGEPLLNYAFSGYNACLFAYGQTGSGKSYSMMGLDVDSLEHSGITPRFCRHLFSRIAKLNPGTSVSVDVSYFEIYNEKIHDLLAVNANRTPLKVREHPECGPYVVDLSVHSVKTYEELHEWMLIGNKNRATAATAMNEKSSRSHSIFSIELCLSEGLHDGDSSRRSKVSLVDLAGSERLGGSHNSEEKIKQGVSINKSLLTLGKVISALAEQKRNQFVPYRESVLTWLLKESLGGNSLTSMLATITPANNHVDETIATLRYACQARSIVNRARINENPHDRLIRELRAEVERLRALRKDYERTSVSSSIIQLDDLSNQSQELEELREKLSQTESQLSEAQMNWEQRFMEVKRNQMEELAAVEKRKEELESHVRVLGTLDVDFALSPLKSNFLEAVDGVLSDTLTTTTAKESTCDVEHLKKLSSKAGLNLEFIFNENYTITVIDKKCNKQTICMWNDLECVHSAKDFRLFHDRMEWSDSNPKKFNRSDVVASMNQIYQALTALQPVVNETENLQLLFAKVNKNLQSLETALLNSVSKANSAQKTVTFNV